MKRAPSDAPSRAGRYGRRRATTQGGRLRRPFLDTPCGYTDTMLSTLGDGLWNAVLMAWEVWWALVLGFLVSAIVQAWVPRVRIEGSLSGSGARPVGLATALGAASSSCSYAAVAIAKSLFQKGASAATALAFQFASTNLVWEL